MLNVLIAAGVGRMGVFCRKLTTQLLRACETFYRDRIVSWKPEKINGWGDCGGRRRNP